MENQTPEGGSTPKGRPTPPYQYAVSFLCALVGPGTGLGGRYETRINIHNPHEDEEVSFEKHLSLTTPPGRQEPGAVSFVVTDRLGPRQALGVTCQEILAEFGFAGASEKGVPKFTLGILREGFVIIASRWSLDVSATYIASGEDGVVQSLQVEQIKERYIEPAATE